MKLDKKIIAHRGLHDQKLGIPENSLLAFQNAIENDYPIELDLHLLKDNTIVVFHDDNLKRMTGVDKQLRNCTYEEIKDLKLNHTGQMIPKLEEVLNLVHGQVFLDIELKYDVKIGSLETTLLPFLQTYQGDFCLKSFHPFIVRWLYKHCPEYKRGLLVGDCSHTSYPKIVKWALERMLLIFFCHPQFIAYDIDLKWTKRIQKLRKKYPIWLWVLKQPEQLEKYQTTADYFICEQFLIKKSCEKMEKRE